MHALPTVESDPNPVDEVPVEEVPVDEVPVEEVPVDGGSLEAQPFTDPVSTTYPVPPLTRLILQRARLRCLLPSDVVVFTAPCPACGADREWTQTRDETRLVTDVSCDCALDQPAVAPRRRSPAVRAAAAAPSAQPAVH